MPPKSMLRQSFRFFSSFFLVFLRSSPVNWKSRPRQEAAAAAAQRKLSVCWLPSPFSSLRLILWPQMEMKMKMLFHKLHLPVAGVSAAFLCSSLPSPPPRTRLNLICVWGATLKGNQSHILLSTGVCFAWAMRHVARESLHNEWPPPTTPSLYTALSQCGSHVPTLVALCRDGLIRA